MFIFFLKRQLFQTYVSDLFSLKEIPNNLQLKLVIKVKRERRKNNNNNNGKLYKIEIWRNSNL